MEEERQSLHPSSSALIALASLTLPSPVLSPTLPTTLTSGDIPILLDLVDQMASSSLYEDDPRPGGFSSEAAVGPSNSNCTVGTFGPIQKSYRDSWIPEPWFSTPGNRGTFGGVTDLLADPALDSHSLAWTPEAGFSITDDHLQFTMSSNHLPSSVHTLGMVEGFAAPNPGDDRNCEPAMFIKDEAPPLGHYIPVHTPDIAQAVLPPSHSDLHYLLSNPLAHRSRLKINPSNSCPSSPRSLKDSSKVASYGDNFCISHARHATVESLPVFLRSSKGSRASNDTTPLRELRRSQPRLPTSLAWLDRSFIELSIDQEGFRAVQARFRFIGYSSRHSWVEHGNSPDNVAQFRPISRQIFNFHYAPLEAHPVLRRITVNGDEARDYITRQASLGLKVNGVYTVQGNEATSLPATFGNGELCWTFEYFVDDRKVDTTGKKTVDGEKSLTPLTFSCSPLLLHPFQGKRITMIHMVKKSVATKLVAEKMEPPSPQTPPKPYSQRIPAPLMTKSSVWNMHARAKSHVLPQTKEYDGQHKPPINLNYHESPPDRVLQDARSIRRRRASSTGEMDRPCIVVASPNATSFPVRHPARHIISRSRLADLLDQETENTPIAIAAPPPPIKFSGFQPLKPSPRHHHARILRP